jgi:hypothetical protein
VTSGSPVGRRGAAPSVIVFLVAIVAACSPAPTPTPTPEPSIAASPFFPDASPGATAPIDSPSPAASTLVAVDASLLDLLPDAIDGHPLEAAPEAAAESASDPTLARHAQSLAVAIAADPAADNFVVASVVKLKPGSFDDAFFRDWRDSFDEGVCGQAGGVSGNAEAQIDGRTVYIGTCAGGVHTYHVHLDGPDAIVSLNVVGDPIQGQHLMETLPD